MQTHQLVLVISKCPEEYTGAKQIEMPENGGSVGRAPSCTLPLADHNRFISASHCLISVYGDTFYISDVSTNGTLVNGNKILKNQPVSIVDGDVISLGQYDIGVVLEHIVQGQDIASDIAPERISNDPLANLDEPIVEEDEKVGALEDLFMETKRDDVQSDDPIEHLNFSAQRQDDYLIRDVEKPESEKVRSIENTRQVVDDSFSIHSEFDIPNLIPENWMGGAKAEKEGSKPKTQVASEEAVQPSLARSQPEQVNESAQHRQSDTLPRMQANARGSEPQLAENHNWEEVIPSSQVLLQQGNANTDVDLVTVPPVVSAPSDIVKAFYEGLGINKPGLISNEALLFKQLGSSLRLCIENLQRELNDVEISKGEHSVSEGNSNLVELMLTLNSQALLSPNELIEQMLDELNDHKAAFNKAMGEALLEQLDASDPVTFSKKMKDKSVFTTKSKLWSEYLKFYANNRKQISETSLKSMVNKNYTKAMKVSDA